MKIAPAVIALLLCAVVVGESATFTVNNTNDSGAGSLRQALLDANGNSGPDTVAFSIPGNNPAVIRPLTPLPVITDSLTMDGYTQSGAAVNTLSNGNNAVLRIELSGVNLTAPAYGLWIAATNCVVRGLVINRFTNDAVGILVEGFDGSVIEGNFIGTDTTGTNALGNGTGILISDSAGNRIGGTVAAARNVIGGNLYGISLSVTVGNEIVGNYVGLGADGLTVVSNLFGIFLHNSTQAQVGGSTPGARNVISGNDNGFILNGGRSNTVQGNFVGTDVTGTLPRGNAAGISLNESSYNLVGGSSAGEGNLLSGNLRSGLAINGLDAKSNVVSGNLIGTEVTGKAVLGNGDYGVFIGGASGNLVGGTDSGAGNVISGNGWQGIAIYHYGGATGNAIQGNFIGTDTTGTNALGNKLGGIWIAAPGNLLGGTNAGAGNIVSGNIGYGVILTDGGSNNVVQGNIIGLDASGLHELGNSIGVGVQHASGNVIGGVTPGARNVISGNTNGGAYNVLISGPASGNRIEGNLIGTDALGNGPLGNGHGVWIDDSSGNTVGGSVAGAGNLIAYNSHGVVIRFASATNNSILGNSIFANGDRGLDLGNDGVTTNDVDALDADVGANGLQNFPTITSANGVGNTILGTLVSAPNQVYRLEFFSNDGPLESDAHGEGRTFLGSTNVTTDAAGSKSFTFRPVALATPGQFVTATATDPDGNTSEFSGAVPVTGALTVSSLNATAGLIGTSITINGENFSAIASNNVVRFGGVRAQVISANSTQLVVNVPPGAGYGPVLVTVDGQTASSRLPFGVTFPSVAGIDSNLFAAPVHFRVSSVGGVGHLVDSFATGDLDGDGRNDFLFSTRPSPLGTFALQLFTNATPPGVISTNSLPVLSLVDQGVGRMAVVAVSDIDGDGKLDVVTRVGFDAGNSRTDVYLNVGSAGSPAFAVVEVYPTNLPALNVTAVGDLDADGRADLLGVDTNRVYHAIRNISAPGSVAFAAPVPIIAACCSLSEPPQFADLDGDGRVEIIWVDPGGERRVAIFRNLSTPGSLGTNSFAPLVRLPLKEGRNQLAIADLDVDGRLDLVVTAGCTNVARVFRNVSTPGIITSNSFAAPVDFIAGGAPLFLTVADFDGDGRPDLLTGNCVTNDATCGATCGSNTLSVLRNLSSPGSINGSSFSAPVIFAAGDSGARPLAGDFDNDGRPDLLVASYVPYFSIWRNALQPACLAAPAGVIGWWPGGGTPNDVVGGHNGTMTGTFQYLPGRVGYAFNFDGDGFDFLEIPSAPMLSPHAGTSGEMTLEAWVLIRSLPINDAARIIHKVDASFGWEYQLVVDRSGQAHFAISSANGSSGYTASGGMLPSFQWHHVAGTYRAGNFIRLYVDGALVDEIPNPNLTTSSTPSPFFIGGSPYFNGMLDEVTLYNRALSGSEIAALASAGAAGKCPGCQPPPSGLVSWWPGDGSGLDVTRTNHGTLSDGVTFSTGKVGTAFQFDGVDDYVAFPSVRFREIPSLSMWIQTTSPDRSIIDGGPSFYTWRVAIDSTGRPLYQHYRNGLGGYITLVGSYPVNDGAFHHLVAQTDDASKTIRLFVDGVIHAAYTETNPAFTVWAQSAIGEAKLGKSDTLGLPGPSFFSGRVDELSFFDRVLSAAEINQLHLAGNAGMCRPFPLAVGVLGGGGVIRSPDKDLYQFGETVTLTATNRPHHTFVRWSDGVTSPSRVVAAGANNNLVASFTNTVPLETLAFKQWDRSFGGVEFDSYPTVRHTPDGGYVLAGSTTSGADGNKTTPLCGTTAAWIVKLDADGNKQWEQTIGVPGDSLYIVTIEVTSDGGYVLGASSAADAGAVTNNCGKTSPNFGLADFWLVRLNASGQRLWDASFGGDDVDALAAIALLEDGGFILAGTSSSGATGNKTSPHRGNKDCWVVRVDANGNKLWDRSFGGVGNENALAVTALVGGGFLVTGNSSSGIEGNKTAPNYGLLDYWAIRLDAEGSKLWDRSYGGDSDDIGGWMTPMPGGGALLVGYSESSISGTKSAPNLGGADYWVVRIDADGNPLWDRAFGGAGEFDWAYNVRAASDGGVMMVGESDTDIDGNKTTAQIGNSDGWLVRLDPYGGKTSEVSLGGIEYDYLWSVDEAGSDAFILAGGSYSDVGGNKSAPLRGNEDFWVMKVVERTAPVGTPVILVNGQFSPTNHFIVTNSAIVSMKTSFTNGHIFYTLSGAPPGTGPTYAGPLVVNQSVTVRALAYNADYSQSVETDPVVVTVVASPVIILQPASAIAGAGSDVLFLVDAVATAPVFYQWLFNGDPISEATNSFLLRTNVQLASAGSYQAVASNPYGTTTSAAAELTVLLPPGIITQPATTNVSFGEAVTFCVNVTGSGPLSFQWRKNGVNLSGQTNSCLNIDPVVRSDGGSYTVVVKNGLDAITSDAARLLLNILAPPTADQFTNATALATDIQGTVRGTNRLATSDAGEPPHGAGAGGRTVWYRFVAPPSGGFTFDTVGSTFDTLLAIYTGTNVGSLTLVARDDDSGGFHTSLVGFTRTASIYYIAVDGFGDESGEFVLHWIADVNLPVIVSQPASQTVLTGGTATFGVAATNDNPLLLYQWRFNGADLDRQTNSQLVISNVQATAVGSYSVRVSNPGLGSVVSAPAVLEIGPIATLHSVDRVEEILSQFGGFGLFELASGAPSVSIGSLGTQTLNTTNSTTSFRETNHCGVIGGASRWFKLKAGTNATFVMDTEGSAFNTVLAVYIGDPQLGGYPTKLIGCNDDAGPGAPWSRVAFAATNGVEYLIAVDGIGGASGTVILNWWLGHPPVRDATPPVLNPIARIGTNLTLVTSLTNGIPSPRLQWYRNQTLLGNATNATLVLNNVQLANAGTYSVVVSNAIGSITNVVARLTIDVPLNLGVIAVTEDGRTHVRISGTAAQSFVIQGTTNFANWIPIYTNPAAAQHVDFDDRSATNRLRRFYRAVPWP